MLIESSTLGFSYEDNSLNNKSMYDNPFKKIWENVVSMFLSPRFIAFYWQTGILVVVGLIALLIEAIPDLGLPEIITTLIIFALTQATKALNNLKQGKEMGFAKK